MFILLGFRLTACAAFSGSLRMWKSTKLLSLVALGLALFVFVELHFFILKKDIQLTRKWPISSSEGIADIRNVDGGLKVESLDEQCQPIPDRWSIMFNPSEKSGKSKFPLVNPHIEPHLACKERYLDIIVMVNSGANLQKHPASRQAIRQTWANTSSLLNRSKAGRWRLFFALGLTNNDIDDNLNKREAEKNNDIIVGNFLDTYKNIPIKTFMSHFWAFSKFDFKYILKTDDDVYARVPVLFQWLVSKGNPRRFHGGRINPLNEVIRDPRIKWYISYEQFNESKWPDFCHGGFQVLSIDLIPAYLYYTQVRRPLFTDDAFLGVIARDYGIHVTDIPGVDIVFGVPKTDCQFSRKMAIGHDINPKTMFHIEETYKRLELTTNKIC